MNRCACLLIFKLKKQIMNQQSIKVVWQHMFQSFCQQIFSHKRTRKMILKQVTCVLLFVNVDSLFLRNKNATSYWLYPDVNTTPVST